MSVINTNVKSLIAQDSLRANNNKLATAMERLSTGSKVNSAKDDAAGLAIGTRMTSQVRGLNMAIKNANDGINLAQTAEGAMTEVTDMLQRMRELAVQAGNSTNADTDRAAMNDEITQLKSEINRIASTTQFNGMNIMDGSFQGKKLQIGNNAGQTMELGVKSVSTSSMGETASGLAAGATRAAVSVSGIANSAAAYSGVSFNATVNGQTTSVTLPTAAAVNPTIQKAFVAADATTNVKATQLGAFAERSVDISAGANIKIAVNDGDTGTFNLDVKQAAADLGFNTKQITGDKMVAALQKAIDDSTYFTGDNKVTVSLNANDNIQFSVAGGAKKIAVTAGASTDLLTKLDGAGAGTGATQVSVGGLPLQLVSTTTDATEVFGMKEFDVAAGNKTLTLTVGAGTAGSVDLAVKKYDNMSDLASEIQSKLDTSGLFSGANHVTVAAVKNASEEWGLTFTSDAGKSVKLDGAFMTVAGTGGATSVNNGLKVSPTGAAVTVTPVEQFGDFQELKINLNDVKGLAAATVSMTQFKLNVNGGGDVSLDLNQAITDLGYTDDKGALSQDQFVAVMQKTIDDSGFFAGDNAVTVGVNTDGLVELTIAGGAGTATIKEQGSADGLISTLTGGNKGTVGGAQEVALSGGKLTLGKAFNDALATADKAPTGSIKLTVDPTSANGADVVSLVLKDTQGNSLTLTAAALTAHAAGAGAAAAAELSTNLNTVLTASTDSLASMYTITNSGSDITIKRKDGVDFSVQLGTATTLVTPDSLKITTDRTNSTALIKGGVAVSSAQQVQSFGFGATTVGGGKGGATDVQRLALSALPTSGNTLVFDGYTKTATAADAVAGNTVNKYLSDYASEYNQRSASKYIAEVDQGGNSITFTAKQVGFTATATTNVAAPAATTNGTASVVVAGAAPNQNLENTLSIKLGNSNAVDIKVADTDFEYKTLGALVDKVQSAIDSNVNFQGANRVVVGTRYDEMTKKTGLTFTQVSGQEMQVGGNLVSSELKEATPKTIVSNVSGGVDLSSNNTVSVSVANADTGTTVTKDIVLASSSKNVSLADYASLLQSGINAAFGNDGYSVTAASANGEFSLGLNQTGAKTITVSGASVDAALGSTVSATGNGANSLSSMTDVVSEMNKDLAAIGAEAHYDAASNSMSFSVKGGDAGSTSTISLSGAGLSSVQFGGNLSATGAAGNATAAKLADIDVLTTDKATAALASIDNSIQYISDQRANLGAIQNRLEHTVNNLTNIVTNTEASRSAIMDADYSKETTALAKSQILTQAATAMLAQANQSSQGVLSLLK